jgi:hypothetical protein
LLVYESTAQLLAEPEARRYLHTVLLTALRDKAERVEIRFGEGEGMLYYRVEGRDWELTPPPDDLYPLLKDALREAARLVRPERPDTQILYGAEGARFEPMEAGWLTYQIGGYLLDTVVRIDPREPFGYIRIDIDNPEDFADAAGEALSDYAATLGGEPVSDDSEGLPSPGSP